MARLDTTDGGWLELTPIGYQFPGSNWNRYDANWLFVEWNTELPGLRLRHHTKPCYLTWEMVSLLAFLRGVSSGALPIGADFVALEPYWFVFKRATRTYLQLELRCNFPASRAKSRVRATPTALSDFAAALEAELVRFPIREHDADPPNRQVNP